MPPSKDDVEAAAERMEKHPTLRTLAARLQMLHRLGRVHPVERRIEIGAEDEGVYHELAHALVAAYVMKSLGVDPLAASTALMWIPIHDNEAFAYALSHHYLRIEPDADFFKAVNSVYGTMHREWDANAFEKRYWLYRKVLKERGLDAALAAHVDNHAFLNTIISWSFS